MRGGGSMKTPDRISIVYGAGNRVYDPIIGDYTSETGDKIQILPCMLNFISKAQLMREYGTINERIMIARFNKEIKPFDYALYPNDLDDSKLDRYELEDKRDLPIKGAVRLKRIRL